MAASASPTQPATALADVFVPMDVLQGESLAKFVNFPPTRGIKQSEYPAVFAVIKLIQRQKLVWKLHARTILLGAMLALRPGSYLRGMEELEVAYPPTTNGLALLDALEATLQQARAVDPSRATVAAPISTLALWALLASWAPPRAAVFSEVAAEERDNLAPPPDSFDRLVLAAAIREELERLRKVPAGATLIPALQEAFSLMAVPPAPLTAASVNAIMALVERSRHVPVQATVAAGGSELAELRDMIAGLARVIMPLVVAQREASPVAAGAAVVPAAPTIGAPDGSAAAAAVPAIGAVGRPVDQDGLFQSCLASDFADDVVCTGVGLQAGGGSGASVVNNAVAAPAAANWGLVNTSSLRQMMPPVQASAVLNALADRETSRHGERGLPIEPWARALALQLPSCPPEALVIAHSIAASGKRPKGASDGGLLAFQELVCRVRGAVFDTDTLEEREVAGIIAQYYDHLDLLAFADRPASRRTRHSSTMEAFPNAINLHLAWERFAAMLDSLGRRQEATAATHFLRLLQHSRLETPVQDLVRLIQERIREMAGLMHRWRFSVGAAGGTVVAQPDWAAPSARLGELRDRLREERLEQRMAQAERNGAERRSTSGAGEKRGGDPAAKRQKTTRKDAGSGAGARPSQQSVQQRSGMPQLPSKPPLGSLACIYAFNKVPCPRLAAGKTCKFEH